VRNLLDRKPSSSRLQSGSKALEDAIGEVRRVGHESSFLVERESSPSSDVEHTEDEGQKPIAVPEWQARYQCMSAHDGTEGINNPNSRTIEMLGKLQAYYERTHDEWRAISYRKAISQLKETNKFIRTEEEART